jgi:hypothetical protein
MAWYNVSVPTGLTGSVRKGVSMRKLIVAVCLLFVFSPGGNAEASTIVDIGATTFVVSQNGTLELGGSIPAGAQGTFEIVGNPSFSGAGYAVLNQTAIIDGESFSIQTALGTCPSGFFCGSYPTVIDNVFGSHPGPGGFSRFDISSLDPALTIFSNSTLQQLSPGSNIAIPSDYQVEVRVSLPQGVAPIPEASTWAMLLIGFVGFGVMAQRRSRKNFPGIGIGC